MKPLCYLNPAKANNVDMLKAFARGSGAELTERMELVSGRPAVFYGVDQVTLPLWNAAQESQHPYFYIDNGYFKSRYHGGDYYRITRNAPQCSGLGESNGQRWQALGLKIEPWRTARTAIHILIACQTDFWHQRHGHKSVAAFAADVAMEVRQHTRRTLIIRGKPGKGRDDPRLEAQLDNCWAVVTHSSMVALQAILRGVPAFVIAPGALSPMACADLSMIETPVYPNGRERWAGVLADNQWRLDEIRNGTAWRMMNE